MGICQLHLEITVDSPVCLSIKNGSGQTVYTAKGASVTETSKKIRLEPGAYTVQLSDFAGGSLKITLDID